MRKKDDFGEKRELFDMIEIVGLGIVALSVIVGITVWMSICMDC